jgi:hypothetical protein
MSSTFVRLNRIGRRIMKITFALGSIYFLPEMTKFHPCACSLSKIKKDGVAEIESMPVTVRLPQSDKSA